MTNEEILIYLSNSPKYLEIRKLSRKSGLRDCKGIHNYLQKVYPEWQSENLYLIEQLPFDIWRTQIGRDNNYCYGRTLFESVNNAISIQPL